MKFTILVKQAVIIPDKQVRKAVRRHVKMFDMKESDPINVGDLLRSANALGIIYLPDDWSLEDEDEELEQSELPK